MGLSKSSPHTRGCFSPVLYTGFKHSVFPAYAGVFLKKISELIGTGGLPRIRGGVSHTGPGFNARLLSSPHTRGCFLVASRCRLLRAVFPAYAGVFPLFSLFLGDLHCLPRIRGGVSRADGAYTPFMPSSPHTRGCFSVSRIQLSTSRVFPAYAGVFPRKNLIHGA